MKVKKSIFDAIFTVITSLVLIVLNKHGVIEKHSAYLLIPLLLTSTV